jgi:hypothetical protein
LTDYVANIPRNEKCLELGSNCPVASTYTETAMHSFKYICKINVAGDVTDGVGHCKVKMP